jgi:hypothetical protein
MVNMHFQWNETFEEKYTVEHRFLRIVFSVDVSRVEPTSEDIDLDPARADFDRFDVAIKGRSFLHGQVHK